MISPELLGAVGTATLFDFIAVRLNPARAVQRECVLRWRRDDT